MVEQRVDENGSREPDSLVDLLQLISKVRDRDTSVQFRAVLDLIGRRSFGPMLLLAGLIVMAPLIGDIPGVPTMVGVFVFLIALQLLLGREQFWLPEWLLGRRIETRTLHKVVVWMMPVARFVDRFLHPRLTGLVKGGARFGVALLAMVVSLLMPFMEVIPFSANAAGVVLTVFGLALIARDGLFALIAFVLTGLTVGMMVWALL